MNRSTGRLAAPILAMLFAFPRISHGQSAIPNMGPPSTPLGQSQSKGSQPKNVMTLEELNSLDAKFHKEMDVAQDAFDRESFSDAEQGFAQLTQEIDDTIKRIAVSTFPKNASFEVDGVKKPVNVQTETELFTRTLDKAKRRKDAAGILRNVADMQKQAMALLTAGKYPDDLDAYRKSLKALIESRSQLDDSTFEFFPRGRRTAKNRAVRIIGARSSGCCGTNITAPPKSPKCRRKRFAPL